MDLTHYIGSLRKDWFEIVWDDSTRSLKSVPVHGFGSVTGFSGAKAQFSGAVGGYGGQSSYGGAAGGYGGQSGYGGAVGGYGG